MPLNLPTSLTPSKVSAFTTCAMAFRFSQIDRLPEPPSPHSAKGTLVHRVLELLHWHHPQGRRTLETALSYMPQAVAEVLDGPEYLDLPLTEAAVILDIPVGTAKSRLHRGLRALRESMRAELDPSLSLFREHSA